MKIVALSDTHNRHDDILVPAGDVLVHAGDFTVNGTLYEVRPFLEWFSSLPHKHKLLIAGNHDRVFQDAPELARSILSEYPGVTYLEDSGVCLEGSNEASVMFWGSPWRCVDHVSSWVFSDFDENLGRKYGLIPGHVDVLITHGPPYGVGDQIDGPEDDHLGSTTLLQCVDQLKPKLHIFGHIHQGYGTYTLDKTVLVNAAILDGSYVPVNQPMVLEV